MGYKCASNDYADDDTIKKGRLLYRVYEVNYKIHLYTDICHYGYRKSLMNALKYYVDMIKKSKDILAAYNLKLKLEIYDEKTKVRTSIY